MMCKPTSSSKGVDQMKCKMKDEETKMEENDSKNNSPLEMKFTVVVSYSGLST